MRMLLSMRRCHHIPDVYQISAFVTIIWCLFSAQTSILGQGAGTFIDRHETTDLRIMSYNVLVDSVYPDGSAQEKFRRLLNAVQPDILAIQEAFSHAASDSVSLLNELLPLPGGGSWHAHQGRGNVIVSKFPLSMMAVATVPAPERDFALALVDLPDDQFPTNLYLMNSQNINGAENDAGRQKQSDAMVNWMRDARTLGGELTLSPGTPMAIVGTLNIDHGTTAPLNNLLNGNIIDKTTYGNSSPPDWDGTPMTDAHPLHNVVGPADYTWNRNNMFGQSRDDYFLYTDSVLATANRFVLNTTTMTSQELALTGLHSDDIVRAGATYFDNLPLVIDLRFSQPILPGDYDSDRVVSMLDYNLWRSTFAATNDLAADGNHDAIVDAADYVTWRKHLGASSAAAALRAEQFVPEPASYSMALILCALFMAGRFDRAFQAPTPRDPAP